MKYAHVTTIGALALALTLTVTGCSAPSVVPSDPETLDNTTTETPTTPGDTNDTPAGEFMVDSAYPWPADTPRPNNIIGEFSGKNPLGDGAVRSLEFVVSAAEAQAYVDSVVAAGWEYGFGTGEPVTDDAGASVSWILMKDGVTGTVSTENGNDPTPHWTFAMLG